MTEFYADPEVATTFVDREVAVTAMSQEALDALYLSQGEVPTSPEDLEDDRA